MELSADELVQVIRPLYGLSESGDYWHETLTRHHINDLKMTQATGDFSLFFRRLSGRLVALSGTYVDDMLQCATVEQRRAIQDLMRSRFDITIDQATSFVFLGLHCDSADPQCRTISQREYISRLKVMPYSSTFGDMRSMRAKLAWATHTRPDIACAISMLSQVTEVQYGIGNIKEVNRIIRYLQATPDVSLRYHKLDVDSLRMLVYVDASYNNTTNNRSQLGYIILLADKTDRCSILHYASLKCKRVTRSSMAGETLAFSHGFDSAYLLQHDLQSMLGRKLPLLMLTDSLPLFNVLTRAKQTSERRLMVDISAAREAYNDRSISKIAFTRSEFNPADGLTRTQPNAALLKLLRTHIVDHPVEQYVVERRGETRRKFAWTTPSPVGTSLLPTC